MKPISYPDSVMAHIDSRMSRRGNPFSMVNITTMLRAVVSSAIAIPVSRIIDEMTISLRDGIDEELFR